MYEETVELLREMIRNACVNDFTPGSGQEVRNAQTLERFFAGTGVEVQRFEPEPGRVSVAFTVRGSGGSGGAGGAGASGDGRASGAEPLTLLGHTDVVPVDVDKWTHDPFAAEITPEGILYGRGAIDMLFITATMAAVTRQAARRAQAGTPPTADLTFVACADEEARGGLGARWLAEHHPDAFSWRNCLSETGGSHLPTADGSDAIVIYTGEKGAAQRRLHVTGDAGHGSAPYGRESAIALIGQVAQAIAACQSPVADSDVWHGFVNAFGLDPQAADAARTGQDYTTLGTLAPYAHAASHTTIAQTVLRAGGPINVLPSHAYLEMDIRPLPGVTQDDVDDMLRDALGPLADAVRIERLISEPATESPASGPLWEAMSSAIKEHFPDAAIVPVHATGGSDLRFARRLGGVGYGFALHERARDLAQVNAELHSHDEKLYLADLELTLKAYQSVVEKMVY